MPSSSLTRSTGVPDHGRLWSMSPPSGSGWRQPSASTTEALSQATRLLALVSAPALERRGGTARRRAAAAAACMIVVVITSTGGVTKRVLELEQPVDPGLVDWARTYLEEQAVGLRLGSATLRRRLEDSSAALERAGIPRAPADGVRRRGRRRWAAALRRRRRGAARRRAWRRARSLSAPARGARATRRSPRAPFRRPGSASYRRPRRPGGRRGPAARRLVRRHHLRDRKPLARIRRPPRPAADGLRQGDPGRSRCGFELSRLVEDVYEDD